MLPSYMVKLYQIQTFMSIDIGKKFPFIQYVRTKCLVAAIHCFDIQRKRVFLHTA